MRSRVLVLAVVVLALLRGWSQTDGEEGRILSLENAWNHALQEKNTAALRLLLAPDVILVEYNGKLMDQAAYLASLQSSGMRPTRIVNESMRASMFGDAAVVNGVYREEGVKNGKPYVMRQRFTDTWIRRGDSWTCVASQSTLMGH
jgi:ketosteroid isomerase-like protein